MEKKEKGIIAFIMAIIAVIIAILTGSDPTKRG